MLVEISRDVLFPFLSSYFHYQKSSPRYAGLLEPPPAMSVSRHEDVNVLWNTQQIPCVLRKARFSPVPGVSSFSGCCSVSSADNEERGHQYCHDSRSGARHDLHGVVTGGFGFVRDNRREGNVVVIVVCRRNNHRAFVITG